MNFKKKISTVTASSMAIISMAMPYSQTGALAIDFNETVNTVYSTNSGTSQNSTTYTSTISNTAYINETEYTPSTEVAFDDIYHINQSNKKSSGTISVDEYLASLNFTLVQPEKESFETGDTFQLEWTGEGVPTTFESDTSFVTVDENGFVTIGEGYWETTPVIITAKNNIWTEYITIEVHTQTSTTTTDGFGYHAPHIYVYEPYAQDLYVGNEIYLDYEAYEYYSISWESDNTDVAIVENGVVTIVGEGTATIYAHAYNGKTATASVTINTYRQEPVEEPVVYIVTGVPTDLRPGDTYELGAWATNADTITYSSSDESVASVDEDGIVTVNGYGGVSFSVVATGAGGRDEKSTYLYVASPQGPEIHLWTPDETLCCVGTQFQIEYGVFDVDSVIWESSDENVAIVDQDGLLQIVGEGVVTISAYAENDETVMDSITISTFADEFYNMEFSLIQPEAESFEPGDIFQLEWTGAGAPTYFESDSYFVTIDENGLVTVDEGYTEYFYVTITAMNNLYIDEITILVHTPNAEQDTLDWPTISLYLSEEVPPMEELEVGDTFDISYESNNALVYLWSSDNEEVATVDDNGKVTING